MTENPPTRIKLPRFCDVCCYQWEEENVTPERLQTIAQNPSADCPRCLWNHGELQRLLREL